MTRLPTPGRSGSKGALGLVRASNRALIRSASETELLAEVCRIAVAIGGYRMAWVALADDRAATIRPESWAGDEAGYLARVAEATGDGRLADEPVATTICSGQPTVVNRIVLDGDAPRWAREAAARGYRSILALPLRTSGRAFGALAIYADSEEAFGPYVVDLLTELSDDLAFGLVSLRIRAERNRLAAAVEQAGDSITVTDVDGRVVYVNRAFEQRSGFRREDVLGRQPRQMRESGREQEPFRTMWATVSRGEVWTGSLGNRAVDGRRYEEEMVVSPLRDESDQFLGYVASGRDVSRERELEDELEQRARAEAEVATRLGRIRDRGTPEATADAIVSEMASVPGLDFIAIGMFRGTGAFVPLALRVPPTAPLAAGRPIPAGRSAYLHDRALLGPWLETWPAHPEDGTYESKMAAVGIKAAAYAPIHGPTALVGLAIVGTGSPSEADNLGNHVPTLLAFAAIAGALLGADHEQQRRDADARTEIEAIIASDAFAPVFQPIVALDDRRVVGYEALTRFADGVSPGERFAKASQLGLGPTLELTCLRRALSAADSLPGERWLSVNASPELLSESSHLERLLSQARRGLVVEVTEDAAIDDYTALRSAIEALGPLVRLAVDDAGAGYAGLRRILELRAAIVKLDMALVRGVDADPARQALIAGMAHFARQTGSQLLAEGVETEAEACSLLRLGVELGQGFLFGRPQAAPPLERDAINRPRRREPRSIRRPDPSGSRR